MSSQANDQAENREINQDVVEKPIPDTTIQQLEDQLKLDENHEDYLEKN